MPRGGYKNVKKKRAIPHGQVVAIEIASRKAEIAAKNAKKKRDNAAFNANRGA